MDGNLSARPVLATKLSLKCKKTNCSQISDNNVFCIRAKLGQLKCRIAPASGIT